MARHGAYLQKFISIRAPADAFKKTWHDPSFSESDSYWNVALDGPLYILFNEYSEMGACVVRGDMTVGDLMRFTRADGNVVVALSADLEGCLVVDLSIDGNETYELVCWGNHFQRLRARDL